MKPLPSRVKIALLSVGLSGLVLIVFGVFAWLMFYHVRVEAVDREIKSLSTRHPGLFLGRGSFERLADSLEYTFGEDYTNKVILLMKNTMDQTLYQSPHWPEEIPPDDFFFTAAAGSTDAFEKPPEPDSMPKLPDSQPSAKGRGRGFGRGGPPPPILFSAPPRFLTARAEGTAWRIGLLENKEIKLLLGINLREVQDEMDRVRNVFLLSIPLALLFIGVGGWVIAKRALRPLNSIAETAESVTAHGLDRRIPESYESPEIRRVITVLNRMMDRLESSFRQATRFSADASHELKTPLAVMQGELELALHAAEPGSSQQRLCCSLMENVQRLKTITRSLLLLAQADAGQLKLALEDVNLSAELEVLLEDARVLAADKRLRFDVQTPPEFWVRADRALLGTAVFNLLSNSVKYSDLAGRVRVELSLPDPGNNPFLLVGNSGPAIPPEEQPKLFNRFYRVLRSEDRTPEGMGLGLSLAREIARAHGGDITLQESGNNWTCFILTLPARKQQSAG